MKFIGKQENNRNSSGQLWEVKPTKKSASKFLVRLTKWGEWDVQGRALVMPALERPKKAWHELMDAKIRNAEEW